LQKHTEKHRKYAAAHCCYKNFFENIEWNVKQLKEMCQDLKKMKEVVLSSICILDKKLK